ncbi:MAG: nitrate reductase [Comamonadaceae bacterium CG_4_9_14_0_8_um_filter_60_18]|nr:MAG: nitrate reductase [Comamonadaceae bacterium CG_4_9_14_0_8_um_filter_60_18]
MAETRSTCPYCGVGCGVIIESQGQQIAGVRGDPDHPANFGRLCSKGATLHLTASAAITAQARLLQPLQRLQRGGPTQPIGWDNALNLAAERFANTIAQHGPDSVGFYISGQLLTEDYYVFNKLAKGLIGTNNVDSNSRLCMSSAVAGYKQTLGMDAPPTCYDDVAHAGTIFIVGANPAFAHPVLFRRIEEARKANPSLKLIVTDPRRTDSADVADLYLPIQPGTDVMLFNGMLHIMLWEGWVDQTFIAAHTSGFEALKALVRDCTPNVVTQVCGITKPALVQAAQWFAGMPPLSGVGAVERAVHPSATATPTGPYSPGRAPTLSLYCQGLNQSSSGTAKNTALINLHLATGQIGKPGAGPFSLTGQPNAMGGREVGGMANLLSGHRDLKNAADRAEVAALWGIASVPEKPGKTAVEMFQAAADGEIKALWIACTNPAQSLPDQATVRRALERAEFVVLQEAFANTATARFADLLLPATTWGEKEGTVTNSERRISRVRAAVPAAGQARDDWQIATDFAQRLQSLLAKPDVPVLFPYTTPEAIWNEHRESTRGRDLDITGMSYALLEAAPQQWPMRAGRQQGLARLYEDGVFPTPDGKAHFVATAYQPVAEPRSARYPFSLTTGRLRDQWHGMSRTGTLGRLFGHASEPALTLNPQDMTRLQLQAGDLVHVTSTRASITLPVQPGPEVALNQAFMAMHWGEEFLSGTSATGRHLAGVNALTTPAYCPDSKQPEFKHSAVKILKADLPWNLLAVAWLPEATRLAVQTQLQALMGEFAFASCVPFSSGASGPQERSGLQLRAAHHEPVADTVLQAIEALLGLDSAEVLRYRDVRRGQRRSIRLTEEDSQTALDAFLLAGDTRAQQWMSPLLREHLPAHAYGRALLMPGATPPMPVVSRGKPVCTCLNVTDLAIAEHLAQCTGPNATPDAHTPAGALASLQATLHCGTQCGSCVPQLQRLVRAALPVIPAATAADMAA